MTRIKTKNKTTVLSVGLICLSVLIILATTLAFFTDKKVTTNNVSFGKIEISTDENFKKLSVPITDVLPGSKLTDAITFSKAVDSEPMCVRAKVYFDTTSAVPAVQSLVDDLNATDLGMASASADYQWSEKYGSFYYLMDKNNIENVYTIDNSNAITLTNGFSIPTSLKNLDANAQYFETITLNIEIQAVQSMSFNNITSNTSLTAKTRLLAIDNVFAGVYSEKAEITSTISSDYLGSSRLNITDESTVNSITFYDDGTVIEDATPVDLSEDNSNTITGYVVQNTDNTDLVDIHISSNNKIALPQYCSNFFSLSKNSKSNLKSINNMTVLNTSKVTNMSSMFWGCTSLTSLDVSSFDTSKVISMDFMFYDCSKLTSLDVRNFDTSNVTSMYSMFMRCFSLKSLDVSGFDTSNVTHMQDMFYCCEVLTSLDVSHFDTSNVTGMEAMFFGCSALTKLDVSNFDTSKVTSIYSMFYDCSKLTSLDVSNFDTSQVTNMNYMFRDCSKLENLALGQNWSFDSVTNYSGMFYETDKAKVFCVNTEQKNWLSDTSKNIISADRVFVLVSDEVKATLSGATWTDLTDYTTIETAVINDVTYYRIKGQTDIYTA